MTEAELILLQALMSGTELNFTYDDESGVEQVYNPAEQAYYTLSSEKLHQGMRCEALIDKVLKALADGVDVMGMEMTDDERGMLAGVLMHDHEALTPELLHGAIGALRRRELEHRRRELVSRIEQAARSQDSAALAQLMQEKQDVDRALRHAASE